MFPLSVHTLNENRIFITAGGTSCAGNTHTCGRRCWTRLAKRAGKNFARAHFHLIAEGQTSPQAEGDVEIV